VDFRTTREMVAALQARKVSARELVDRAIARIEAHDNKLNAVVVRDFERARTAAAEADKLIASGERRALLGVPMTVKECFNVAGLPTTWGIPGTEQMRASDDAVAVAQLKRAGAVILGKTNIAFLLSDWQSVNPIYGVTNNPWDLKRTAGGSSGGAAAALAAAFVSQELGTDLVGSLRIPANFCGVFAHKPTHGLIPMRGSAPPGTPSLSGDPDIDLAVVGPMARSAGDLGLALDVLAGPDDADAVAYQLALPAARHQDLKRFRVLVLDTHPMLPTASVVRSALDTVASRLEKLGTKVARQSPLIPDLNFVAKTFGQLLMAFIGADTPPDAYEQSRAAAAKLPPDEPSMSATQLRSMVMSHREWIWTDRIRASVAHQWRQFFREWDVLLCPVSPTPAFPHDHGDMNSRRLVVDGQAIPYGDQGLWSSLATLTGLPSTAMPIGRSDNGLPIGMQIIGPYLEDRTTIAFAELVEREFGGFVAPPGFEK
jgi:amidase